MKAIINVNTVDAAALVVLLVKKVDSFRVYMRIEVLSSITNCLLFICTTAAAAAASSFYGNHFLKAKQKTISLLEYQSWALHKFKMVVTIVLS